MDRTSSSHPANPSGSSSPSVPPAKDGSPPSAAEAAKIEGNTYFGAQRYAEAVKSYSVAIIRNPNNPIYYSNRALAHIRLDEWTHAVDDCERGLDLKDVATEAILLKLYFYKGQALLALEEPFDLALAQKSTFIEDIAAKHRSAKAQRFERQDRRRRAEVSELHGYLVKLVQRDRDRQLKQLEAVRCDYSDDSTWEEEEAGIKDGCTARLSEIEALFSQANENSKKRYVPDAFLGKISFEVMTDPVISPASGITYDRPEIVSHLQKIGKWDPLTRQPLHEKDLVPNLALKEVIDEFLSLNGWAFDY
ncbi:Stub1 protein [Chytriomyces sp. MP71]|nr:Stub1 protein [Chytriomyces sp. MP71]